MVRVLINFPAFSRRLDSRRIIAVEQLETALEIADDLRGRAVGQKQEGCAVKGLVIGCDPDRLLFGVAILASAVRKPGTLFISPKQRIQGLGPLRGAGDDNRPLARFQGFFQKLG